MVKLGKAGVVFNNSKYRTVEYQQLKPENGFKDYAYCSLFLYRSQ